MSKPPADLDPLAADRRTLLRYILQENAKRGVTYVEPGDSPDRRWRSSADGSLAKSLTRT